MGTFFIFSFSHRELRGVWSEWEKFTAVGWLSNSRIIAFAAYFLFNRLTPFVVDSLDCLIDAASFSIGWTLDWRIDFFAAKGQSAIFGLP